MTDAITPTHTPAPAAATLIALLAENGPRPRPGPEEGALLRALALVYGFLHQQGPGVLLDPDRWLEALLQLPFTTPAGTESESARGREPGGALAPRVERALRDGRTQEGASPSLPRFLREAAPFLFAPPAPGRRQAVTVVTARVAARAGDPAVLAVSALALAADPERQPSRDAESRPHRAPEHQLTARRSALTLNLADPQHQAEIHELTSGADVRALVRLPTFVSLTVSPE